MLVLSLAGCSAKGEEGTKYDTAQLQEMSEFIITTFASMSAEDFDQFLEDNDIELQEIFWSCEYFLEEYKKKLEKE